MHARTPLRTDNPLDRLLRSAARHARDAATRQWLQALLRHGERASGTTARPPELSLQKDNRAHAVGGAA